MKKLMVRTATIFTCFLMIHATSRAQAEIKAKKFENPQWKTIVLVDLKPGKNDRALEIIKNYFVKANEKSGVAGPSLEVWLFSGEWDYMLVWDFKEGIEEMNWETSPNEVKWLNSMNEIAGSPEKGKAILDEFASLVNRSTSYIGKIR